MRKISSYIWLLLLMAACQQTTKEHDPTKMLPDATGSIDEILVVMNEDQWNGKVGESLRSILTQDYSVLPQKEPLFNLVQVPVNGLINILKRSSSILIVGNVDAKHPTARFIKEQVEARQTAEKGNGDFVVVNNPWAKPQQAIFIHADTEAALLEKIEQKGHELIDRIYEIQTPKAFNNAYVPGIGKGLTQTLRNDFNLQFNVPENYKVALRDSNLLWLRADNHLTEEVSNIMFYTEPYQIPPIAIDKNTYPIAMRDTLGRFVKSGIKGSYMLSDRVLPFEQKQISLEQLTALETRGLWRMENDFMGGPFINYFIDDEANQRRVIIDGFVYAPKMDKRILIRKLEAMFQKAAIIK